MLYTAFLSLKVNANFNVSNFVLSHFELSAEEKVRLEIWS
ncbi:hypothetical protein SAMN02745131_00440 [Flavisolibacter ginsengisoli DSM 18119]|uniref:Uncharacterized protein n=1 Tax=Flavisolibacter ginsengisoli DSM 18119 TaxID=1121884 RepID=A0A1M4TFW2_9BACT|nr:hypothetical protein SAMN02745131_00440 [Flavisolibacter ginsengisoli DSM 18119]